MVLTEETIRKAGEILDELCTRFRDDMKRIYAYCHNRFALTNINSPDYEVWKYLNEYCKDRVVIIAMGKLNMAGTYYSYDYDNEQWIEHEVGEDDE